jgi:trans-AT polyketide synthase/acyltransferase/oxidoreductase domain-containing protein
MMLSESEDRRASASSAPIEQLPVRGQGGTSIAAGDLGSSHFKADYGIRYAYLSGAMYKGIASKDMVVAMGRAGLMGYFGTGGLGLAEIESTLCAIQRELAQGQPYGMNLLCSLELPELEERTVELYFKYGVRCIEAAAFMRITPSLVHFRLKGLRRNSQGRVEATSRIMAKVSRPEVARAFLEPAPEAIVRKLVEAGRVTATEAQLSASIPMADDLCVEADSGGHTDQGVAYALMPAMLSLRDEAMRSRRYARRINVGAAGGIGTPHAAAAAFVMGADFVLTGSINQCTVEAGTSAAVKDLLQEMDVQDTAYAPAGDMFELGAKVQVLRRGLFFPARANKLYELYQRHAGLEDIDAKTRQQIQEKFFKRSFAEIWNETRAYYQRANPRRLEEIESNPKQKMALIFKWYFVHTTRLALAGSEEQKVDYQVHCGPALGAFNQWVKGTELQDWRKRHVALIAERLMQGTAERFNTWLGGMSTARSA